MCFWKAHSLWRILGWQTFMSNLNIRTPITAIIKPDYQFTRSLVNLIV